MIVVGSRWSLKWKYFHRIEVTVLALEVDLIRTNALHRCGFSCDVGKMLGGDTPYSYSDFYALFVPMAVDAIALPGGVL